MGCVLRREGREGGLEEVSELYRDRALILL